MDNISDSPEGELFARLLRTLHEYESTLCSRLMIAGRNDVVVARQLAGDIVDSIRSFRVPPHLLAIALQEYPHLSGDEAFRSWSLEDPMGLLLEAHLAREAIAELPYRLQRLVTLSALMHSGRLSNRATAYLDRMSRCYVLGMDDEFAIMARSLTEVALADSISEAEMREQGFTPHRLGKDSIGYSFVQYTTAAEHLRRLHPEQLKELIAIRDAGNRAVHAAPGTHSVDSELLFNIVDILLALFPRPSA